MAKVFQDLMKNNHVHTKEGKKLSRKKQIDTQTHSKNAEAKYQEKILKSAGGN